MKIEKTIEIGATYGVFRHVLSNVSFEILKTIIVTICLFNMTLSENNSI